jgi:DNA-binding CsgD family transcriptional regulator
VPGEAIEKSGAQQLVSKNKNYCYHKILFIEISASRRPIMTEETPAPARRAEALAAAKTRRAKRIERREACFDLLASGYSHRQIANAMKISVATVRRAVDRAIAERRLDAPERYIHLQVARLSRALCHADFKLAKGDHRAFAPYIKLVAELDRYHGLDARYRRLPRAPLAAGSLPPLAPLALPNLAEPLDLVAADTQSCRS